MKPRYLIAASMAVLCGAAWSQATLLGAPAKTPAATESGRLAALRKEPHTQLAVVAADAFALESNIISVDLDGKSFRFVGSKQTLVPGTETWIGRDGDASAIITRENGILSGHFDTVGKVYVLTHLGGARYALRTKVPRPVATYEGVGK